ncbi:MAG: 2,3-bisphosphoglycerate-independent phosphoglycerate mutase [Patescibacteria group bacterium]
MKKILLLILDGWGINPKKEHNPIAEADPPYWNNLLKIYPNSNLHCKEESVGLPNGCLSGSEVGHTAIGAGRVVWQQTAAIDKAIENGTFFDNEILQKIKQHTETYASALHLVGMLSDAGIHSHINHLNALIEWTQKEKMSSTALHLYLDGRDMPPMSALGLLRPLQKKLPDNVAISTLIGRSLGMDRTENWERTITAYNAILKNDEIQSDSPIKYIEKRYAEKITDEFMQPANFSDHTVNNNDAIIFFNFRADRMRQMARLFTKRAPHAIQQTIEVPQNLFLASMAKYHDDFSDVQVLFSKQIPNNTLPERLDSQGLRQFRIAETEKYAHITYFFNGGRELTFANESRIIIPSLGLENYAPQPEMSLPEITKSLIRALETKSFDFLVCNIANGDIVGHSGEMAAGIKAVLAVDRALSQIVPMAAELGYTVFITADHGNIEYMHHAGQPHTAHTFNGVPLVITEQSVKLPKAGFLNQTAPTILDLMDLQKPKEMTSASLLIK